MRKILYNIFFPVCLLAMGLTGCKDDDGVAALPEAVPLIMTVNNQSFVMGDHLIVDFNVDGEGLSANEDFDIYLTAKSGDTDQTGVFKEFSQMITFKKGESSLQLDLPIVDSGITSDVTFDFSAFARGYRIAGSTQSIIVSDYYRTVVSLKGNADREVKEGETFVIVAKVPVPVTEDVVVNIKAKEGEADWYENLPVSITIPAGETTVESATVTIKKDRVPTGDKELALLFETPSAKYPLMAADMTIKMKDAEEPLGEKLQDERWVYLNPSLPFMSEKNKTAVKAWYTKDIQEIRKGDPHPNSELSDWKFYNALEFHYIPRCFSNGKAEPNSFGNHVPWCFAAQNTASAQTTQGVNNEKYSTITDEGILKMWSVKETTNASGGATGQRDYGVSGFYSSKFAKNNGGNVTYAPQHTRIYPGMRLEVRARIRGAKNGFNAAIWLQGIAQSDLKWPLYGEIDIMENPAGQLNGMNCAYQTFHMGDPETPGHQVGPTKKNVVTKMDQWNIYWMEWIDENTVSLGINGQKNITITKSDLPDPAEWPFDKTLNPEGLYFILTFAAPNKWALGDNIPANWNTGFASIDYTSSKTNVNTPRMEIDWVRFYTNSKYDIGDRKSGYTHNNFYFY